MIYLRVPLSATIPSGISPLILLHWIRRPNPPSPSTSHTTCIISLTFHSLIICCLSQLTPLWCKYNAKAASSKHIDHPCHHVDLHGTSNPVPLSIRSDHDLRLVWVCSHPCNNSLQSWPKLSVDHYEVKVPMITCYLFSLNTSEVNLRHHYHLIIKKSDFQQQ